MIRTGLENLRALYEIPYLQIIWYFYKFTNEFLFKNNNFQNILLIYI